MTNTALTVLEISMLKLGWVVVNCMECLEKRDQNVFCNILHKTWVILIKFVTLFPE